MDNSKTKKRLIPITENLQAVYPYGKFGFPCQFYEDNIRDFCDDMIHWHWQMELEFSYIEKGCVELQAPNTMLQIEAGQGHLILPNKLHCVKKVQDVEGIYQTVIADPKIIYNSQSSILFQKYYIPVTKALPTGILHFDNCEPWHQKALLLMQEIIHLLRSCPTIYEPQVYQRFLEFWIVLYENLAPISSSRSLSQRDEDTLLNLLLFIQTNYYQNITLADIAAAGTMSRSQCCRFFKRAFHVTPFEYLIHYRVQKSLELLRNSDQSVTVIADKVGFNSINHYSTSFKQIIGYSPKAYRQKCQEETASP